MPDTPVTTSTDLQAVLRKISTGELVALDDLLSMVRPPVGAQVESPGVPVPKELTPAARDAALRLPEVFGQVCPEAARILTFDEIKGLFEERGVLDTLADQIAARKEDIRTIIFNHFDEQVRDIEGDPDDVDRTKEGHFILPGSVNVPDTDRCFRREPRGGTGRLDPELLLQCVSDEDIDFEHEDYLAITTPVRVVDQAKVMIHLRKRPQMLSAIKAATIPATKTAQLHIRKQKGQVGS